MADAASDPESARVHRSEAEMHALAARVHRDAVELQAEHAREHEP